MGDRSAGTVTIRVADYEELVRKHFKGNKEEFAEKLGYFDDVQEFDHTVSFVAYDVNGGTQDSLEDFLIKNNIEFNKQWDACGGAYEEGEEYYRLVNGELRVCGLQIQERDLKTFLEEAIKIQDPKALQKLVKARYKKLVPFRITSLDEEQSVKFIKDLAQEKKGK